MPGKIEYAGGSESKSGVNPAQYRLLWPAPSGKPERWASWIPPRERRWDHGQKPL